jgi:hypothetical protein
MAKHQPKDQNMTQPKRIITALFVSAISLAMVPAASFANNGNGKGNGNGGAAKVQGQSGANHGALASELKGLNSAHASANALAHASPNSRVGKNRIYQQAAIETNTAAATKDIADQDVVSATANLDAANQTLADANAALTSAQADLQAAIDGGLDTTAAQAAVDAATLAVTDATTAQTDAQAALGAAAQAAAEAQAAYDAAVAAEHDALLIASGGRNLSPEALAEYRRLLGL